MISLLTGRSLFLCLLSALGWISVPLVFQWYLDQIVGKHQLANAVGQSLLIVGLISAVFFVEFQRFVSFVRYKPVHAAGQSLAAKLSQDRLWAIDVPNILSHSLIAGGGLLILSFRDFRLSLLVVIWFAASFYIQSFCGKKVRATAEALQSNHNERHSLILQEELLKKQVLASGLSTVLRISGQVVIYSLLFLTFAGRTESSLAAALADIEYVALILTSLQMIFSSLPKISELKTYLA